MTKKKNADKFIGSAECTNTLTLITNNHWPIVSKDIAIVLGTRSKCVELGKLFRGNLCQFELLESFDHLH